MDFWDEWFGSDEDFGGYDSQEEYDYWETDNGEFDQDYFENNFLWTDGIDDYTYEYDDSSWLDEPMWVAKEDNQGLGNTLSRYTGSGSLLGGLLGGTNGSIGGSDIMKLVGGLGGAYLQDRSNDRYNEMMQPMTDLYKAQAADVAQRRANRDVNLANEYAQWEGMMQPGWDRRDQRAENLRYKQGQTQSSSSAWDRAANEQFRDLTKLQSKQQIANAYDERTGILGGQLRNPWTEEYGQRQQNPYLNTAYRGLFGV